MENLKFNNLLVLYRDGYNNHKQIMWTCLCDCGNYTRTSGINIRSGHTKSCGCLQKEKSTTHGYFSHPLYNVWSSMQSRCYNKTNSSYKNYGARGITVCEEWKGDSGIARFIEDMGIPDVGLSLDRIDVNGNYCKENCRWADSSEQGFNKRKFASNKSGKTGVRWYPQTNSWLANITKNSERIHIGYFKSLSDAIKAREDYEIKLFGYVKP